VVLTDKKYSLYAIMACYFLTGFMGSAMIVVVPVVAIDLHMSVVSTGWILTGFVLASAALLMPVGNLSDSIGHGKMCRSGILFFAISTFACAFAPSGEILIFCRVLQGASSAMVYCSGMALVSLIYPTEQRGRAIGWVTFTVYVGLSVGPVFGGFLNEMYGWRSILHITWVLSAFVSIYAYVVLPPLKGTGKKMNDFVGTFLFVLMVLLIFGGLSIPNIYGYSAFAIGLVFMAIMVLYEYNHKDPLINVRLFFSNHTFGLANTASMLNYCATSAVLFLVSIELQINYGLTSEKAGLIMLAQPLAMAIVTPFAGRMADKTNPKGLAFVGMMILTVTLFLLAYMAGRAELYHIAGVLFVFGVGLGIFSTPNNTVIMNSVEKKDYGFASSSLGTMRLMGQSFSVAATIIILENFAGSSRMAEMSSEGLIYSLQIAFVFFALISAVGAVLSLAGKKV
jgi:EmrB/QacA subfamily drug resistance transporter